MVTELEKQVNRTTKTSLYLREYPHIYRLAYDSSTIFPGKILF